MISHKHESFSKYTKEELYDLVLDVLAYPKFLPWCAATRIIKKDDKEITADMVISFIGFQEKYTSLIIKDRDAIFTKAVDGPFNVLESSWKFTRLESSTKIEFSINFEFKSKIMGKFAKLFFDKALKKIVDSFEKRADYLYGKK